MIYKNLHYEFIAGTKQSNIKFVLLHGWGHSLLNIKPIAEQLGEYDCYLIDLPGFGQSDMPTEVLSVSNYTDIVVDFIRAKFSCDDRVYIVGHSFGGRIAVYLGAYYPQLVSGIFVVAGAGLNKHKRLGRDVMTSSLYRKYYARFASADYKNATPLMREILKKTVLEDLSHIARSVSVPTTLIYGERDTTTPAYFGKKYNRLIKNSRLYVLPTFDHNSILSAGKYQVASIILNTIKD